MKKKSDVKENVFEVLVFWVCVLNNKVYKRSVIRYIYRNAYFGPMKPYKKPKY